MANLLIIAHTNNDGSELWSTHTVQIGPTTPTEINQAYKQQLLQASEDFMETGEIVLVEPLQVKNAYTQNARMVYTTNHPNIAVLLETLQ